MGDSNYTSALERNYELWEYLLIVQPCQEVSEKILGEKRSFENNYEQIEATNFNNYITIASFLAKEAMEQTFIRWMQNICNLQKCFTVTLNNYSGLPSSGLYLRIQDQEPFKKLANELKILDGFMQSNECPPLALVSSFQMSFVTGLSYYNFETAIKEYAQKTFHESFIVDKLVLMKRNAYGNYRHVNTFILPHS